jgi:hypothetical protein
VLFVNYPLPISNKDKCWFIIGNDFFIAFDNLFFNSFNFVTKI